MQQYFPLGAFNAIAKKGECFYNNDKFRSDTNFFSRGDCSLSSRIFFRDEKARKDDCFAGF